MSTVTAQMMIGGRHPNHGGIMPTHLLLLHENSRPVWELFSVGGDQRILPKKPIWIPTVEHMLEDGILMAACYVWKQPAVVRTISEKSIGSEKPFIHMYEDFTPEERDVMYGIGKTIGPEYHAVLSVHEDSTLYHQLPMLYDYQFGVEVCVSTFVRGYSSWIPGRFQHGTLAGTEGGMGHD